MTVPDLLQPESRAEGQAEMFLGILRDKFGSLSESNTSCIEQVDKEIVAVVNTEPATLGHSPQASPLPQSTSTPTLPDRWSCLGCCPALPNRRSPPFTALSR